MYTQVTFIFDFYNFVKNEGGDWSTTSCGTVLFFSFFWIKNERRMIKRQNDLTSRYLTSKDLNSKGLTSKVIESKTFKQKT
jgi:hypothetical protein